MVYVKDDIVDALRAAIAANPPADTLERLKAELARLSYPEDMNANQDAAYNYMLGVQDHPETVPDNAILSYYLAWISKNLTTMPDIVLGTFKDVIHNVVGSSAHDPGLRDKLQTFKRNILGEYDDNDPVEAGMSVSLTALAAAQTPEAAEAALAALWSRSAIVPTEEP